MWGPLGPSGYSWHGLDPTVSPATKLTVPWLLHHHQPRTTFLFLFHLHEIALKNQWLTRGRWEKDSGSDSFSQKEGRPQMWKTLAKKEKMPLSD